MFGYFTGDIITNFLFIDLLIQFTQRGHKFYSGYNGTV